MQLHLLVSAPSVVVMDVDAIAGDLVEAIYLASVLMGCKLLVLVVIKVFDLGFGHSSKLFILCFLFTMLV